MLELHYMYVNGEACIGCYECEWRTPTISQALSHRGVRLDYWEIFLLICYHIRRFLRRIFIFSVLSEVKISSTAAIEARRGKKKELRNNSKSGKPKFCDIIVVALVTQP